MGLVDRGDDDRDPRRDAAADVQAVSLDAASAAAHAGAEVDPGQVQGRQAAPAAGGHEVLQGEQRQPVGLLSPAGRAAAGVHLALLHAARGPANQHLPEHPACLPGFAPRVVGAHDSLWPEQRRELPVHLGHHEQGDGHHPDRPDRPLCRHSARVQPDDGEPDDGQDPAADHDVHAAGVRVRDRQVPRRPARLLDHDQHVDDGPAVLHPPGDRACRAGDCRPGDRRRRRGPRRRRRWCQRRLGPERVGWHRCPASRRSAQGVRRARGGRELR